MTRKKAIILKLGHKTGTVTIYKRLKRGASSRVILARADTVFHLGGAFALHEISFSVYN